MAAAFSATDIPSWVRRTRPAAPEAQSVVGRHRIHGAVVLTPEGVLDHGVLQALDGAVAATRGIPVILDLSACALTDMEVVEQLDGERWATSEVRIVCPRRSARQLLARAGVSSGLTIFWSVEQAIA